MSTALNKIKTIFCIDLRALALFRVVLGFVIVTDLGLRAFWIEAHYTDFGSLPRHVLMEYTSNWRISFHMANGSYWFQALLFVLAGISAVSLTLGYKTRISTIISWLLLLSLQNRNFLLLQGGDNLLLLLLFWSMFLPLGARYAIDSALNPSNKTVPNQYFSMATVAILIQVMSVYFFSGFLKSGVEWYPNGTALYYALSLDHFTTPIGVWLREFQNINYYLSLYVYALELFGPILIFMPVFFYPFRITFMVLFILLEIGFIVCLKVGLFPFISITSLLLFMPGIIWNRFAVKIKTLERTRLIIYYDGSCTFCKKTCLLLQTFLLLPDAQIVPAQSVPKIQTMLEKHNSWVVADQHENTHIKWQGIIELFRCSPLFFPLATLFKVQPLLTLGENLYHCIEKNRASLSRWTARIFPFSPNNYVLSAHWQILILFLLIVVTVWNVSTLQQTNLFFPKALSPLKNVLRLDQKWSMFAPHPSKEDVAIVIPGVLKNGRAVDVLNKKDGEPGWKAVNSDPFPFHNYRWRKHLRRLWSKKFKRYRLYYGRSICRSWNRNRNDSEKLDTFKIYAVVEHTAPDFKMPEIKKNLIWYHHCFKKK